MAILEKGRDNNLGKYRLLNIVIIFIISFSIIPIQTALSASGPGYYINGFVKNAVDYPIANATVKITNIRTGEYLMTTTDLLGRYIVDLSNFPSGYELNDLINASARFNTLGGYVLGKIQDGQAGTTIDIVIADISAPSIYHTPIITAMADEALVIRSDIEDDIEVSAAVVWYMRPGKSSYDALTMTLNTGNTTYGTWVATIPEIGKTGSVYYYISANDTTGHNNCSDILKIDISHGKPDHFILYASSECTAGIGFNVTAAIVDRYNIIVSNYTGNVVLWTTDPNSISIGSFATFQFAPSDEGTHIFRNIILCTAPSQVIGIHDLSDTQIQANMTIIVLPNAPSRLDIVPKESTILVGMFSPFSLRLLDEYGNIVPTSQILSVELTTTSSNGSFSPAGFMIFYEGTSETTFFYRETDTSGSPYQLTASALSLTVANALVHVVSSDANRWAVTPTYVELTAGESISFILQLQDAFGNPMNLTGDTLVNLTTTSRTGVFKYGDNIMESVVLKANTSSLELNYTDWNTANSPCFLRVNNGTYVADGFAVINITSTSPSQLAVSQSTTEAVAGTNVTIIAKVLDRYGNICVGLNGPIYLNTTDSLTSDQSRSLGDLNQDGLAFHVALYTVGVQTLTIECWGGTVKNTVIIRIKSGNVNSLELLMPDSVIAGTPFSGMAYVLDEYGNLASDYNGTISFTSDDPYPATLPSAYTFTHEDSGRHMFSDDFILFTIPERNITVQDEEVAWLNDTQNITIFDMTPPRAYFAVDNTSLVSGMRYNFTLDAWDDVYISKVTFYYSYDNTTFSSEEMNQSSGNISTGIGNYSVDMKLEEGTLHFYFFVSDGANQIHVYEGDDLPFSFTVKSNNNITHAIVLTLVIVFVSILLIIFYRSKTKRY